MRGIREEYRPPQKIKPRNIIRIIFLVTWLLVLWQICLRFQGTAWRVMLFQWTSGLVCLYLATVTMYFTYQRDINDSSGFWERAFIKLVTIVASVVLLCFSFIYLRDSIFDIFVNGYQTRVVTIKDKWHPYRSFYTVTLTGEKGSFREFPSQVSLEPGKEYLVEIFPNSRFIIGIRKK